MNSNLQNINVIIKNNDNNINISSDSKSNNKNFNDDTFNDVLSINNDDTNNNDNSTNIDETINFDNSFNNDGISFPEKIRFVISGPSECGKTCLLKNLFINRLHFDIFFISLVLLVINMKMFILLMKMRSLSLLKIYMIYNK